MILRRNRPRHRVGDWVKIDGQIRATVVGVGRNWVSYIPEYHNIATVKKARVRKIWP